MTTPVIIGLSVGGAVLFIILFIICVRVSNTKRFDKKYRKQMKVLEEEDPNISFEKPMPSVSESSKASDKNKDGAIIEDYVDEDLIKKQTEQKSEDLSKEELRKRHEDRFARAMKRFEEISQKNKQERESAEGVKEAKKESEIQKEKDDFEEFMNEHSYGRMFADKTLFEQIQDLSPELKAILFSGIFRPYDEDK